jgi:succinate dehydrogenase / fumarate reductase cytochrome b subunit
MNYRLGMWAWLGQRITGLALVVYLFMHIFVISSAVWRPGGGSFNRVLGHLQSPAFIAADLLLVAAVIFHVLNGFRILLTDVGIGVRRHKVSFWILMALAAFLVIWGVVEAVPFILGASLEEPRVI